MLALGVLVSALALYREAPRENINPDYVLEAVMVAAVSGLFGARALYIILNWDYYSGRLFSSFFTQFEGLSFYGGFLGGIIMLAVWSRWRKVGFLKLADLAAPYLILGYGFGRIGCFLNGCCFGKESDLPWAIAVGAVDGTLRHPVQLYAALGALAIFILLKKLRPVRPFVGFIFIALFAFYGLLRFTTEFFRYGELIWFNLTLAQLFSLGLVVVSLAAVVVFYRLLPEDKPDKKSRKAKKKKASDNEK